MTGPHVVVTLDEIYRQLVALSARIDSALGRHEHTERTVAGHDAELRPLAGAADRIADHEVRLRGLERGRWPIQSATILVALAAAVIALVSLLTR